MAIIGDLVPPRERGKYQGQMAGIMALAMIAGPLVGGLITDHANWRWAFFVNLPVGVIALAILVFRLNLPKYRTEHRIDWLGAGLLSVGITALVLITTWGGSEYAWGSWQILGLAALAAVTLVAFGLVERRAAEPILSLQLFRNRNFSLVAGMGFLVGFAMFGAITFLPLYQQTVQGASATNSGLLLLPMMAGMLVTSVGVGRAITKSGRYRIFPIVGGVLMVAGMFLLSRLDADTSRFESSLFMVVLGAGMGFLMQTTMLIAQNSVEQKDLGVASSAATFFRSIGGSFGVALFGAIFVWIVILLSHLAFRRRHRAEDLPVRMPLFPVMQIAGLALLAAILVTMGLDTEFWNISWIVGVPWLGFLTLAFLIRRRRA